MTGGPDQQQNMASDFSRQDPALWQGELAGLKLRQPQCGAIPEASSVDGNIDFDQVGSQRDTAGRRTHPDFFTCCTEFTHSLRNACMHFIERN